MMDGSGFFLFTLVLSVLCYNAASETAPSNFTKPSGICRLCQCRDQTISCFARNITKFFTKEQWADLKSLNVTHVDLSENFLTEVTAIAELPIKELYLSHNKIETIENSSFKDLRQMDVLDLSHNSLTSAKLSPHAFQGRYSPEEYEPLAAALRTLSLAYNDLHSLNQDLFQHVPELTELDLSGNNLGILDHATIIAVSSLPNLKVLYMRACQLIEIPDKFFHALRHLERLDISNNRLKTVPQELKETENLIYLNLNQNPIVKVHTGSATENNTAFPRLPKLEDLFMCHMPELSSVGAGSLAGLESLTRLYMSFNPKLRTLDAKALVRFDDIEGRYNWPPIEELYLQSNNLSEVNSHLLDRWDLVEKINVSDNPFVCDCSTQWMVDVLAPMVERKGAYGDSSRMVCHEPHEMQRYTMKYLHDIHRAMPCFDQHSYQSQNPRNWKPIEVTPTAVIQQPHRLIDDIFICRLCHCEVMKTNCNKKSARDDYKPISALRVLSLAYNNLRWLDQDLFEHIPKLVELDLSGNPLKMVDTLTLTAVFSLPRLKVLYIRDCQIKETRLFHVPLSLERLDISGNQFEVVSRNLEENRNLVFLSLDNNPIVMIEAGSWDYPAFPRLRNLIELHMSHMTELRSIGAGALAGLENLVKLHMNFNPKLSKVDALALASPGDTDEVFYWPPIKELYLQSNNLSEVDSRLIDNWDLVEKLDVSENPFRCDCTTQWMIDVLVPMIDQKGDNSSRMDCAGPEEMRGYSMKYLHVVHRTLPCDSRSQTGSLIGWFTASSVISLICFGFVLCLFYRVCRSRLRKRTQKCAADSNTEK